MKLDSANLSGSKKGEPATAGLETAWLQATRRSDAPPSQDARLPNNTADGRCERIETPAFLPASTSGRLGRKLRSVGNAETLGFGPDGKENEG